MLLSEQGAEMTLIEMMQDFPEINPANYGDDEVNALNAWGIAAHKAIEALQADYNAKCSELELVHESRDALQAENERLKYELWNQKEMSKEYTNGS